MAKITVDKELCIGCAACTAVSSEIFELDDDGKAQAKKAETETEEELKQAKEGADTCPVNAIKIEE